MTKLYESKVHVHHVKLIFMHATFFSWKPAEYAKYFMINKIGQQ